MTWYRVDDTFAFDPRAMRAGNAALGLWLRAGTWSAQQLTDGHIPRDMIAVLGTATEARRLVASGLWREEPEGYVFDAWEATQPTRAEVEKSRAAAADRQARSRAARRAGSQHAPGQEGLSHRDSRVTPPVTHTVTHTVTHGVTPPVTDAVTDTVTHASPPSRGFACPDPTRPDPEELQTPPAPLRGEGDDGVELTLVEDEPKGARGKRRRRIPADWQPSEGVRANVDERFPGWEQRETVEEFRDYWLAAGKPMADWDLTWRNRVREVAGRTPRTVTGSAYGPRQHIPTDPDAHRGAF